MNEQTAEVTTPTKRKYTRRIQPAPTLAAAPPKQSFPQWVTAKEEERADKMIGKRFVRIDPETGGPDKSSKEFYYQVTNTHPYMPAVVNPDLTAPLANTEQHLIKMHVQKYHRNEFDTVTMAVGPGASEKTKVNRPVAKWAQIGKLGDYKMVIGNEDGNFHMDFREFVKQFMPDPNE